jgi:hypothetical protein
MRPSVGVILEGEEAGNLSLKKESGKRWLNRAIFPASQKIKVSEMAEGDDYRSALLAKAVAETLLY